MHDVCIATIGKMEGKILEMHNDGWNMGEGFGFDVLS